VNGTYRRAIGDVVVITVSVEVPSLNSLVLLLNRRLLESRINAEL